MTYSPDFLSQQEKLSELCAQLKSLKRDEPETLARHRINLLADYDVYRWFVPTEYGGFGWETPDLIAGYLELSKACLSTAFVLTQRSGAVKRLSTCDNDALKAELLPRLASGEYFATVGISHLTTSRRHLGKPVLVATRIKGGFQLDGFSPWVTGVTFADYVVIGATCEDEKEIMVAVPTSLPGVSRPHPPNLVALSDSYTGEIRLNDVKIDDSYLVAGPKSNIMAAGAGGNTGGLQTSTLALGLAHAAIEYMEHEMQTRKGFERPTIQFRNQWNTTYRELSAIARGNGGCTNEQLRTEVNSLVLRSTQAALMVAKGAGFCESHPVGRWCQEALFFLVWSCPSPVAQSNLCELAQIS